MPEDDYFQRLDAERKARMKAQLEAEAKDATKKARREAHFLKCGKCGADMATRQYRGVEIEVCADCGAVLLDQGELESLAGRDQGGVLRDLLDSFRSKS